MMKLLKLQFPVIAVLLYLLAVGVCLFMGFDFEGAINPFWTLGLIILTLPWSIVSIIFSWALIHGAGLGFFAVMYLVFAGINSLLIYWFCSSLRKGQNQKPLP
jgi:hypothetical protein